MRTEGWCFATRDKNLTSDTVGLSMPIDSIFYPPAEKYYSEIIWYYQFRNMQKIMTHGVAHNNITSYQETSLQYYGKTSCIVATVFIKIKKFYEGHNNAVFSTWKQQLRLQ